MAYLTTRERDLEHHKETPRELSWHLCPLLDVSLFFGESGVRKSSAFYVVAVLFPKKDFLKTTYYLYQKKNQLSSANAAPISIHASCLIWAHQKEYAKREGQSDDLVLYLLQSTGIILEARILASLACNMLPFCLNKC